MSAIVKVDKRHYRKIAQQNWGLTDAQMVGMHVHHRVPVSLGGTNDPSNLYVCSPSFHARIWHGPGANIDLIEAAREGGRKGGRMGKGKKPWNKGKKTGPNPAISEANKRRVWTEESKEKCKEGGRKNKGNKRPDLREYVKKHGAENAAKRKRDSNGRFT